MLRRLAFLALAPAAAAASFGLLSLRASGAQRAAAAPPLLLTAPASGWRAPGVPVAVTGFAGARARVVLRAGGRPVAATVSGVRGRFALRFVPHASGRYRLVVQSAGAFRPAGT